MKAIPEQKVLKLMRGLNLDYEHKEIAASIIEALEEIDTLTVSKLRPMCDAPDDINILVEHDFSNIMTESRAMPNKRLIITAGGFEVSYDDCDGWLPIPTYKRISRYGSGDSDPST